MSGEAKRWVERHSDAKAPDRNVLEKLACFADAKGRGAWRSAPKLAHATGLHVRTVQRALKRLEDGGHIARHLDGCSCKACGEAPRSVVVYDVRMAAVIPGQLSMPTGGATNGTAPLVAERHQRQSAVRQQRRSAVGSNGGAPPLKDPTTNYLPKAGRAGARKTHDPDAVPASFPAELSAHLDLVVGVLVEVAEAKGAGVVRRGAVARTLTARPRRPMIRAAHDFAAYFLDGKGAQRSLRDVVSAYRNWLDREGDLQSIEPLPGEAPRRAGAAPPRGRPDDVAAARRRRRADALRQVTGLGESVQGGVA